MSIICKFILNAEFTSIVANICPIPLIAFAGDLSNINKNITISASIVAPTSSAGIRVLILPSTDGKGRFIWMRLAYDPGLGFFPMCFFGCVVLFGNFRVLLVLQKGNFQSVAVEVA